LSELWFFGCGFDFGFTIYLSESGLKGLEDFQGEKEKIIVIH
jgi:hypothetical protein